ncbi:inversin protein alternative-like [Thraustotheca clavata]|uniref:Inversin protein alternative-like n=1 Tax=Thraustotheca clavata TaxID=74557 RepID=A0A1V9ZYV8_9STRA|nr:inversin protein alternative-like [Thraustotheca clavata]
MIQRLGSTTALVPEFIAPSCTPLHTAVLKGNLNTVRKLVARGLVNQCDHNGNTPLHHTCLVGRKKIAEVLLKSGAQVNAANDEGNTPLHKAAIGGHLDCVELLLNYHANVLLKNKKCCLASDLAGWRMHTQVTALLQNHDEQAILAIEPDSNGNTKLHFAAGANKFDVLMKMIKSKELSIDVCNNDNWTSLHVAAHEGHYDAVKCLIENGANMSALTITGENAKSLSKPHKRVYNLLILFESTLGTK